MHKRKARWTNKAVGDLESAHSFLSQHNPFAAQRLAVAVLRAIEHLQEFPESGAVAGDLEPRGRYRHWPIGRHRIIYRLGPDAIWILRIWDARRNPSDLRPE